MFVVMKRSVVGYVETGLVGKWSSYYIFPLQFDGEQGDYFQQQAAEFVRSQFTALENLKQQQKRDQRLANFLQEQENNPVCRRLQLKDMLPAGFQRLSKVSKDQLPGTPTPFFNSHT